MKSIPHIFLSSFLPKFKQIERTNVPIRHFSRNGVDGTTRARNSRQRQNFSATTPQRLCPHRRHQMYSLSLPIAIPPARSASKCCKQNTQAAARKFICGLLLTVLFQKIGRRNSFSARFLPRVRHFFCSAGKTIVYLTPRGNKTQPSSTRFPSYIAERVRRWMLICCISTTNPWFHIFTRYLT